jgi:hypothetical protein
MYKITTQKVSKKIEDSGKTKGQLKRLLQSTLNNDSIMHIFSSAPGSYVRPENKVPKNLKDGSGMKHILLTQ